MNELNTSSSRRLICSQILLVFAIWGAQFGTRAYADKPIVLFDGTSLGAWQAYEGTDVPSGWVIREESLFRESGGGDLMTKEEFGDFELELEWKISSGGNSGIMYRVGTGDSAPYESGPEYQILDSQRHADGKSRLTSAGALYGLYPSPAECEKPAGQWNATKIVVKGNHIEHWLNGQKVVDCELGSDDWTQRVTHSKFAAWPRFGRLARGHIVLQDHGDPVWYRNIRITPLP